MNSSELLIAEEARADDNLLSYYAAIEHASQNMLNAARAGDWDTVVKLEGACAVLIAQLRHASEEQPLGSMELAQKTRIMQRILVNDAEIRNLAEPWINDLGMMIGSSEDPQKMH